MSENLLQFIAFLKIISIAFFAYLYGLGGIKGKWRRRFIAPFILTSLISLFALWIGKFNYWIFAYYPLLCGALHLGYGANTLVEKIKRRSFCGLINGIVALPLAIIGNSWTLLGLHIILCVLISVVLGVWNICKSARDEETVIAMTIGCLPMFMI